MKMPYSFTIFELEVKLTQLKQKDLPNHFAYVHTVIMREILQITGFIVFAISRRNFEITMLFGWFP